MRFKESRGSPMGITTRYHVQTWRPSLKFQQPSMFTLSWASWLLSIRLPSSGEKVVLRVKKGDRTIILAIFPFLQLDCDPLQHYIKHLTVLPLSLSTFAWANLKQVPASWNQNNPEKYTSEQFHADDLFCLSLIKMFQRTVSIKLRV